MSLTLKTWTPDDVQAHEDQAVAFSEYAQQTLGVPWPTIKDQMILRKKAKEFFKHYPHTDWRTLCRVVQWAANRKKRYAHVWAIVDAFRYAYKDGALPELDPQNQTNQPVEDQIYEALQHETDEVWRRRLMLAQGVTQQKEVLREWHRTRNN